MVMGTLILGENYQTESGENSKINEILFSTKDKSIIGMNVRINKSVPNLFIPLKESIDSKKANQKGMIHFSKKTIVRTNDNTKSQLFGLMVDKNTFRPNYFLIKVGKKILSVKHELLNNITSGAPTIDSTININDIPIYLSDELATKEANYSLERFYASNYSSMSNVKVEVISGIAHLSGTCQFNEQSISIENFMKKIEGVLAVKNDIVSDSELEIAIAKKLADASIFQDGFVSIRIFNNKISLKGNLGSQKNIDKVQSIIEEFESIKLIENNIKLKS